MVTAVIVAAGKSRRMGKDKLTAPLCGIPVIAHTIGVFEGSERIDSIVLVCEKDRLQEFRSLVARFGFRKVAAVVAGGKDRHLSVWAGLQAVGPDTEFIAIHDGGRPLTTQEMIAECLQAAKETGAACCAAPIPDTVKRADDDCNVTDSVDRAGLWAMQTPQIFRAGVILQAYRMLMAANQKVTDEVSAVQRAGRTIRLVSSSDWNFKITLPKDLVMAEQVLAARAGEGSGGATPRGKRSKRTSSGKVAKR